MSLTYQIQSAVPEAGIKGRHTYLHPRASLECYSLLLPSMAAFVTTLLIYHSGWRMKHMYNSISWFRIWLVTCSSQRHYPIQHWYINWLHGPLAKYVKLRFGHAPRWRRKRSRHSRRIRNPQCYESGKRPMGTMLSEVWIKTRQIS